MPPSPKKTKKEAPRKGKTNYHKSGASDHAEQSAVTPEGPTEVEEWDEYEEATETPTVGEFTQDIDNERQEHAAEEGEYEEDTVKDGEYEEQVAEYDKFEEREDEVGEYEEHEENTIEDEGYGEHMDDTNVFDEGVAEYNEFSEGSIEEPPPTPVMEEPFGEVKRPTDLEIALKLALERLENMPKVEFLQSLSKQADVHAHAVMSAKEIANDFVAKASDLAEAMQMILQYDQLMLRKLNLTTAYDFGVKPKTDEEIQAVMIDRAQKMLNLGQLQYEMSHQLSDAARPLVDYRFEACDDVNAVKEKLTTIEGTESAKKEALAARKAQETQEHQEERNGEHSEGKSEENAEDPTKLERDH
ncbi:hypothetical protein Aperf_G00000005287 [Anoplocephala perfoliata]